MKKLLVGLLILAAGPAFGYVSKDLDAVHNWTCTAVDNDEVGRLVIYNAEEGETWKNDPLEKGRVLVAGSYRIIAGTASVPAPNMVRVTWYNSSGLTRDIDIDKADGSAWLQMYLGVGPAKSKTQLIKMKCKDK